MILDSTDIQSILHFSDVHLNLSDTSSIHDKFGIYGEDASKELFSSALNFSKSITSHPQLLLYTGDHVVHSWKNPLTQDEIKEAINKNVEMIHKQYPFNLNDSKHMMTAILGNSDCKPDYHLNITNPKYEKNPYLVSISSPWKEELSKNEFESFQQSGLLLHPIEEGLYLVSINTVPYSINHTPASEMIFDPFGQFKRLREILKKMEEKKNKVFLVGHIPPIIDSFKGTPQWHQIYLEQYEIIIKHYSHIIQAQLFGHIHSLEFRIPQKIKNFDISFTPLFTTGSISPLFGNNPSFTIWNYHRVTKQLVDYHVYAANLTHDANELTWKRILSAKRDFGLKSMTISEFNKLSLRMMSNETLFQLYYHQTKAFSPHIQPCHVSTCRAKILCTQYWVLSQEEYMKCIQNLSLFKQEKQDTQSNAEIFTAVLFLILIVVFFIRKKDKPINFKVVQPKCTYIV